jgi:hypothetical protein
MYKDCPHKSDPKVQANYKKNLDEFLQRRQSYRPSARFDPNNYKKDGFVSKHAVMLFNDICATKDMNGNTRRILIGQLLQETSKAEGPALGVSTRASRAKSPVTFTFWRLEDQESFSAARTFSLTKQGPHDEKDTSNMWDGHSFQFSVNDVDTVRYPIASELPHVTIPVGKDGAAMVEGLLDSGGACTMGDLAYWKEVAVRAPALIAHFQELSTYQEKPISIGGVGAGKVEITHIMGLWLPWQVGTRESKLVIGLGENMPVTLLIGLPFQIAAQCVVDIGNQTCTSNVFGTTWKLTLKMPHKKSVRVLDQASSTGLKRLALPTQEIPESSIKMNATEQAMVVSPSPAKRNRISFSTAE